MITLRDDVEGLVDSDLEGFHAQWSYPMPGARVLAMLCGSAVRVVAVEQGERDARVVGYAAAISDGAVFAYLSSVEVRESHRGRGLGRALVQRVLDRCRELYAVDLLCDEGLVLFYAQLGFARVAGMCVRNRGAGGRLL
jgi:GNAT superfamily N-acetyltransferase